MKVSLPRKGHPAMIDNASSVPIGTAAETGAARHWATHGSDTNYVFGVTSGPDGLGPPNVETSCPFEPDEASLSRTIMTYWANFAATGDPNVAPSAAAAPVKWPRFGDDDADALERVGRRCRARFRAARGRLRLLGRLVAA